MTSTALAGISVEQLVGLAGLIGTCFFGVVSIVFYIKSKRMLRIDAIWSASVLQSRVHSGVHIHFNEIEVEDISRLRVMFVNTGTEPVRRIDFPAVFKGCVIHFAPGTKLLSAECVTGNYLESAAECFLRAEVVRFGFDYLNPGQEVGVEVFYSGNLLKIGAQLIGGQIRERKYSRANVAREAKRFAGTLVIGSLLLFLPSLPKFQVFSGDTLRWAVLTLNGLVLIISGMRYLVSYLRHGRLARRELMLFLGGSAPDMPAPSSETPLPNLPENTTR